MISSFPLLAVGAVLCASPVYADIPDWTLRLAETTASIKKDVQHEVTLKYQIGKGRDYKFSLLQKGCDGTEYSVEDFPGSNGLSINEIEVLYVTDPSSVNTDNVVVAFDFDLSSLASSLLWNGGDNSIEFCARFDLLSTDGIVKTDKSEIDIGVDFKVDFTTTDDVNLAKAELFGDGEEGLLTLETEVTMSLPGFDPTGIDETGVALLIQAFETVLATFLPGDATIEVISFANFQLGLRRLIRQLQVDYSIAQKVTIPTYCDGTNDCIAEALTKYNAFKDSVTASVTSGEFIVLVNAEADALSPARERKERKLVEELNGVTVGSIEVSQPEFSLISFVSQNATVRNYVKACTCDDAVNFACNTNVLGRDDFLNVCIEPTSTEVEVDYLDSLVMTQGDKEFVIVQDNLVPSGGLVAKVKVPERNGVHVASVIPAKFFSYESTSTASVSGVVFMKLAGSRRRLAVEMTGSPEVEATGSRALTTTTADKFDITVMLERSELGAGIKANDPNASTSVMTTGVIVASAAAAVVASAAIVAFFLVKRHRRSLDKKSFAKSTIAR